MSKATLLITIVRRDFTEKYAAFFQRQKTGVVLNLPCSGTAQRRLLDYLGMEDNQKTMFQTVASSSHATELLHGLVGEMGLDVPGCGIAMSVPLQSAGGQASLDYFSCKPSMEEDTMEQPRFSLIIAITEPGYSEMVMDAAREAGARGGTVVHAKGTAKGEHAKFFGISLAPEKEMVYIVTRRDDKDPIIRGIMATRTQENPTVVFSLPVEDVAGLRSVSEPQGE